PSRDLPLDLAAQGRGTIPAGDRQGRARAIARGRSPLRARERASGVERQLGRAHRQHRAAAPLSGRMRIDRSSTALVVATNVAVIGIAWWQHWPLVVPPWPYSLEGLS